LTSEIFSVAETEEERFWRIIHEFCTAPIQAAHGKCYNKLINELL